MVSESSFVKLLMINQRDSQLVIGTSCTWSQGNYRAILFDTYFLEILTSSARRSNGCLTGVAVDVVDV